MSNRSALHLLVATLLSLAFTLPSLAAEQAWITKSNANAALLLNFNAKYDPEEATAQGVDGYDEQIIDLSRDLYEQKARERRAVIAELQKRLRTETDRRVRQDLAILIGSAEDRARTESLEREHLLPFMDLSRMAFDVVRDRLDPRVPKDRQRLLLTRLNKYAGLAKGYRPITELANERLQQRLKTGRNLVGPYKGEVEQAISDTPTMIAGIKEELVKSGLQGWETSFAALEQQLTAYAAQLKSQTLPRARADHRLPPAIYADRLHRYGVDITPQELMSKALTSFAEIRNQMTITAGQIAREQKLPDPSYLAVIRALKRQQIPADKVMPLYAERLAQIEAAVRDNHVVTLPSRKAVIRLASAAENASSPAPHMNPPRLIGNTGEYGEFVLTTATAAADGKSLVFDDFTHQAGSWSIIAHEARPGHELQFSQMIETGVSTARAVFAENSVNVEGWALYAEAEMQPYEPLDGQLFALQSRMLRAARAFLDPMVNLGQTTPEEVKSFLIDEVGMSEGMATQEMQRYTFRMPGQATSYFYGYQRLMETRELAEVALRKRFNRQAFNDFVLSQGLVPPALLRKAVLEEFVPSQR